MHLILDSLIDLRTQTGSIDNGFEIELIGAIAHIVALSMPEGKNKQAAFDEKTACSVTLVTGPATSEN